MRGHLAVSVLLSLCMGVAGVAQEADSDAAMDRATLQRKAGAAYESEDFRDCAEYYALAAELASGLAGGTDYYNAACCRSLGGDVDAAFDMLELAIDAGFTNHLNLSGDPDLAALRGDARMDALLERIAPPEIVITKNVKAAAAKAEFVFQDAHHFVHAMELIHAGADTVSTLQEEYLAKASPGLNQLVVKYPFTALDLARAIQRHPADYDRVARSIEMLEARVPELRAAYERYEELTADVVFPPTYFLVGRHRGIGSGSPEGQLITFERRTDESIGRIETLLVHELTHFQQLVGTGSDEFYALFGPKKSLLGLTIREGIAEFIADLVTNRMTQDDARGYLIEHEPEVWERFQREMLSDQTAGWMWSSPSDPDQPRDLAYVLGARIAAAYYDRASDKRVAIQDMFAVVDYVQFLTQSGYGASGGGR